MDDRFYLLQVDDALERIDVYVVEGREAYFVKREIQDVVLRNLRVMAESTQRLSERFKVAHPQIDWRGIVGLRNILAHSHLGIKIERIWELVEKEVPRMRAAIRASLETQ